MIVQSGREICQVFCVFNKLQCVDLLLPWNKRLSTSNGIFIPTEITSSHVLASMLGVIAATAPTVLCRSCPISQIFSEKITFLTYPHKKKSSGLIYGLLGGCRIEPVLPIHWPGKKMFNAARTQVL